MYSHVTKLFIAKLIRKLSLVNRVHYMYFSFFALQSFLHLFQFLSSDMTPVTRDGFARINVFKKNCSSTL